MKRILFLMITFSSLCYGQKIDQEYKDNFTAEEIKTTKWDILFKNGSGVSRSKSVVRYRFKSINNDIFLQLRIISNGGQVFSIHQDHELILSMNDDKLIRLNPMNTVISNKGGGSVGLAGSDLWGLEATYKISDDSIADKISKSLVHSLRIYTDIGFVESNIKDKTGQKFRGSINLML